MLILANMLRPSTGHPHHPTLDRANIWSWISLSIGLLGAAALISAEATGWGSPGTRVTPWRLVLILCALMLSLAAVIVQVGVRLRWGQERAIERLIEALAQGDEVPPDNVRAFQAGRRMERELHTHR